MLYIVLKKAMLTKKYLKCFFSFYVLKMITKIAVVTKITETKYFSNKNDLINYLITENEVVTGKSQTEALPY